MIRAILMACAMLLAAAGPLAGNRPTFDADAHPKAPDYRDRSAWAALPDRPNAAAQAPPNADRPAVDPQLAQADVFYVHPTTELSKAHWNQDLTDAVTNDWTDSSVVARQASVFSACCRIYAPRYRQAAPGSVTSTDGSGQKAFDLAYGDVRRAFLFYLAHYNHGRPFIIAGHSQGSLHIYRLLEELVDGKPLQRQFVAAYTPGIPIALGEFGERYTSIKPCAKPADTGCIASWNGFEAKSDPASYRHAAEAKYRSRHPAGDATTLCVNPLTFDTGQPAASASANLGALPGKPSQGQLPSLIRSALGARCDGGILMIDEPAAPGFYLHRLPAGSLHYNEIDLFYANIRQNASARVERFVGAGAARVHR